MCERLNNLVKPWIFAHRGQWDNQAGPNSELSIQKAISNGFSVETDIRDLKGEIVISHDPCVGNNYKRFSEVIDKNSRIAINVKSDGLVGRFQEYIRQIKESKSFIFDCSFPELLKYKQAGIPHAIRMSEYERELAWVPDYIWLDCFESDWWLEETYVLDLIRKTPTIVVSPELHGREHFNVWQRVLELRSAGLNLSVCTDFPAELAIWTGLP